MAAPETGLQRAPVTARLLPAVRAAGIVAGIALFVVVAVRAAGSLHPERLAWGWLPLAVAAATGWWVSLAAGWALLASGRIAAGDIRAWCRTQTLRYLPG